MSPVPADDPTTPLGAPRHLDAVGASAAAQGGIGLEQTQAAPSSPSAPGGLDHTLTAAPVTAPAPRRGPGLEVGRQLAHFRIDGLLGEGGMGQVYRATDLALDRPVALKVLQPAVATDPDRRARMIREAQAQAKINHPNVCHIYFIGEEGGLLFFAMELIEGQSVADRLGRGPIAVGEALEWIRMAALGLREADRLGFTHRDVKPSNLMLDRHGQVRIVDFGLVATSGTRPGAGADHTIAAAAGAAATSVAGTPLYMAPEQARGVVVDRRADIYALGATLYHLIAGHPPFQADSAADLMSAHASSVRPALAPVGTRRGAVIAVDALCRRMMATAPADRFADYDALLTAIDRASPIRTRPAGTFARAFAGLLDLLAMALILLSVQAGLAVIGRELGPLANVLLWLAIFTYASLSLARYGRTAGMAALDLELIDVSGPDRPSWRQTALRTGSLIGAIALVDLIEALVPTPAGSGLAVVVGALGFLAVAAPLGLLVLASARRADKRPPWDLLAGTQIRYRRPR
ncbi:MAG: protein kinase [Kofleriaceae bacterium]|nr:protein kinase [Kofleriaceae bacterium]